MAAIGIGWLVWGWRDGCALPQRLSRFPAAWSALTRRSLGDRRNAFTWNWSTSQTHFHPLSPGVARAAVL
jgi:hypothetical protein